MAWSWYAIEEFLVVGNSELEKDALAEKELARNAFEELLLYSNDIYGIFVEVE